MKLYKKKFVIINFSWQTSLKTGYKTYIRTKVSNIFNFLNENIIYGLNIQVGNLVDDQNNHKKVDEYI